MLTFQDAVGQYQLPTSWAEVSTRQFCDYDRAQFYTVEQRASFFAGRPIQVNGLVANALTWCLRQPSTEGSNYYPQDLGQEPFILVESIRTLLLAQPLPDCFAQVYATFLGRGALAPTTHFNPAGVARRAAACLDWPITDTYPAVANCLAELRRLDEAFAVLTEKDETEAGRRAAQAGSDRLAAFGHLNVALAWAERFGVTLDEAYQVPYQTMCVWLVRERVLAEIHDKLREQKPQE